MNIIALFIGVAILGFGVRMELQWRHRIRHWTQTSGIILDEVWDAEGHRPKIRFRHKGKSVKFVSGFRDGWFRPSIGSTVPVIYDPETLAAKHNSFGNRWAGALTTLSVGSLFVFAALKGML